MITRVSTTIIIGCVSPARGWSGLRFSRRARTGPLKQCFGQRVDQQRGDAQNDDFTVGIKATEIDKDDVDDVGAAAALVGIGEVKFRNRRTCCVAQQVVIGQGERSPVRP